MAIACSRWEMEARTDPRSFGVVEISKEEESVRITTLLRSLLGVSRMFVTGVKLGDGRLVVDVRPCWKRARCSSCCRRAPGYDSATEPRSWQALAFGTVFVELRYRMRRVACKRCGIRVEQVPWADPGRRFTRRFEEMVAYLAQVTDMTSTSKLMAISWVTVANIVAKVVNERLDDSRFDGVRRIGIDEFSYRKRHKYLTIVVDHDAGRVIWTGEGRGAATVAAFFKAIGPERLAELELVTCDMAAGYLKALREQAPHAKVVLDRFHVQRLASDALDRVRRDQWRELQGSDEGRTIKRTRFALLKNPWNQSAKDKAKLSQVQKDNAPLYRAYLLKETLAAALDYRVPALARRALDGWLAWATRSRLAPFVKLARTVRKHKDGILAYVDERYTNGIVEGINNRLRAIARRAFGYHSPEALSAMAFLVCGGITLRPPIPGGPLRL